MTNQKKIQVGEVYTVKDVEADPSMFIGAEIKVCWTPTSFAQMTLVYVWEDDEGFTVFDPVGLSGSGGAVVEGDMRVEVLGIKDDGMPTVMGAAVSFYYGDEDMLFFATEVPASPGDAVFQEPGRSRMRSWAEIKAKAAGRPIYVSEPSWEKVGE